MRYILALDEGTTSARAVVYDTFEDKIIAQAHQEFKLIYKQSGWVEADAVQIYAAQVAALNEVIAQSDIDLKNVYGIGVTNQRETVVVWDRVTGAPLYNAIIWQCRRTAKYCETLSEDKQLCESIQLKTGLRIDAYFSATKIKWLLDNVSGLKMRAERGEVLIGTIDSYIIYRLSRGKCFVTDMSNASRTMLFNIHTKMWDKDLLQLFGIPLCALPRVIGSDEKAGKTAILNRDIDICGIAGDQQAALFGQTCFKEGDAKNTYGTGCFILINSGKIPKVSVNSLLTTIAWKIKGEVTYAYEGSVFNAGSAVQWLRDKMDFFKQSSDSEVLALQAKNGDGTSGTDGVYVVPAFTGLGAPYWNQNARGIITGITRNTDRNHIIRATLESLAYSTKDVLICMEKEGLKLNELNVDGGAGNNNFLMQFQADILGCKIIRPVVTESTVMGAVYLCGLGTGAWKSIEEIKKHRKTDRVFSRQISEIDAQNLYIGWQNAVKQCTFIK